MQLYAVPLSTWILDPGWSTSFIMIEMPGDAPCPPKMLKSLSVAFEGPYCASVARHAKTATDRQGERPHLKHDQRTSEAGGAVQSRARSVADHLHVEVGRNGDRRADGVAAGGEVHNGLRS